MSLCGEQPAWMTALGQSREIEEHEKWKANRKGTCNNLGPCHIFLKAFQNRDHIL